MPETIKVDVFPGEWYSTLTVRILPLVRALEKYGVKCRVILPIAWDSIAKGKLGRVLGAALTHHPSSYYHTLFDPPDVVIIGRTSTPQIRLLQRLLISRDVKMIFDLDDPLFLPISRVFGINVRPGSFCLEGIIKNADFVTVDNHYLLRYVKPLNENASLIHVPVDVNLFFPRPKKHSKKITIGWQGAPKAHYENLAMLAEPLERIAREYDITFKIASYLGDPFVKQMFRKLEGLAEVDYGLDHWVPVARFAELLSDFDIMLSPLVKTAWYEGKSSLRVGPGMAMGLPVVASPVGEQKYLVKHGVNGFLAEGNAQWHMYIAKLIEDDELRRTLGERARETAEKELSVNVCGRKMYEITRKVVECG